MSENNKLRPFKQVPSYDADAKFEITGAEMKAIEEMAQAYSKFISIMEQMLMRQLQNGLVTVKYFDMENNEISQEEIREMFIEYAKQNAKIVGDSEPQI